MSCRQSGRLCALVLIGSLVPHTIAYASRDPDDPPAVRAVPRVTAIQLDGRIRDHEWHTAPPATGFTQREPDEGQPATQRTEIRFMYDADAIYVCARMYDDLGRDGVVSRLVRRDGYAESDLLEISFDTFHDHVGRTVFTINPAGVKGDAYGPGGHSDDSWDPVWEAATSIDSLGWSAEIRIPFSQLRFPRDSVQTWGLQILRIVNRLNELSMWAYYPSSESGGPAFFGHLDGLEIQGSPAKGELLPYVVASDARLGSVDQDDPFYEADELGVRIGADLRYLLTSNLTLTATVNPDFGQVEVDPAVVNLSDFETFFPERRPFFVEGGGFLSFGGLWCFFCSNISSMGMYYSRRIGRSPQASDLASDVGGYANVPGNTTILGAAKITGRTSSGWSIGMLDALSAREHAIVELADASRTRVEVEPLTNYFIGRAVKDLDGGNLQVRAIATSVIRDLRTADMSALVNRHAEGVGLESEWWFAERRFRWATAVGVTQVTGTVDAILRAQQSSARYFQRPDREHGGTGLFTDALDSSLTAMRGFALQSRFSKEAGDWLFELNGSVKSPGYETNDLGFLTNADYLWMSANVVKRATTPGSFYRNYWMTLGGQQEYNFDGDLTSRQVQASVSGQLLNYWNAGTFFIHRPSTLSDRLTRGGPVVRRPATNYWHLNGSTDSRKSLMLDASVAFGWNTEGADDQEIGLYVRIRPASNISLSVGPSVNHFESTYQYVTAREDPTATNFFGTRYVFADLTQNTVAANVRLNVTFTATLTLELFAQPFISSARYTDFKEYTRPRALARQVYGKDIGTITRANDAYTVDPDGNGPATAFRLDDPNFTFRSLRGNVVLRWEFRPGSTIFLVWTQSRSSETGAGSLDLGRDVNALLTAPGDNIFLVKVNYWIGF